MDFMTSNWISNCLPLRSSIIAGMENNLGMRIKKVHYTNKLFSFWGVSLV